MRQKSVKNYFGKLLIGIVLVLGIVIFSLGDVSAACTCSGAFKSIEIKKDGCSSGYDLLGNFFADPPTTMYYLCGYQENVVEPNNYIANMVVVYGTTCPYPYISPIGSFYESYGQKYTICRLMKLCGPTYNYINDIKLQSTACPSGYSSTDFPTNSVNMFLCFRLVDPTCTPSCTDDAGCTVAYSDWRCSGSSRVRCVVGADGCLDYLSSSCADTNVCTTDVCSNPDGNGGVDATCIYSNNAASCNDGNECTSPDICSGGSCTSSPLTGTLCYGGICQSGTCTSCIPDCTCASNTCVDSTCSDNCGGTCAGTKIPSKTTCEISPLKECGMFDDNCGGLDCGDCVLGEHCTDLLNGGTCVPDCQVIDSSLSWLNEKGKEIEKAYTGQKVNATVNAGTGCSSNLASLIISLKEFGFDTEIQSYSGLAFDASGIISKEWEVDEDAEEGNYYFKVTSDIGNGKSEDLEVIQCAEGYVRGSASFDIESCDDYNRLGDYAEEQCELCGWETAFQEVLRYTDKDPLTARCYWADNKCKFSANSTVAGQEDAVCSYNVTAEECEAGDDIRTITYREIEIDETTGLPTPINRCENEVTETVLCPRSTKLPFFSWINLVGVVILIAAVYLILNYFGKRKKLKKKK